MKLGEYDKNNFLPFKLENNDSTDVNLLLRNTKLLVLNTKRYKNFQDNYANLTQTFSFKLPEVNVYPIRKNEKIISMNTRNFDVSFEKKYFLPKTEVVSNHISNEKDECINTLSTGFRTTNEVFNKNGTFLKSPKNYQSLEFNNFNKLDIQSLSNINLNLTEVQEFVNAKNSDQNIKNIKDKIKDLGNGLTENDTIEIKKIFNINTKDQAEITLSSIEVIFKSKNKEIKAKLPICILPIFYYTSFQIFKKFLSKIINFKNNYNEVEIDFKNLKTQIKLFYSLILNNQDYNKTLKEETNFKIDWLTNEDIFDFQFTLPKLYFYLKEKDCTFEKTIEKDLLIFMYLKNFVSWDVCAIDYLTSFKLFRDSINKLYSKRSCINKINLNFINLDKVVENNVIENINEENNYEFIFTNFNNKNEFYVLKSYIVTVKNEDFKLNKKLFKFILNFNNLKSFSRVKKFYDLEKYIRKNLNIDHRKHTIKLKFQDLTTFSDNFLKFNISNNDSSIDPNFEIFVEYLSLYYLF